MRAISAIIAAAALTWSATAFAADPVGTYDVQGSNPGGGSSYRGTVTVEKTGETYRVVWVVGGTRYVGTGIGNREFLAVSYRSGKRYRAGDVRRRRRQLEGHLGLCRRAPDRPGELGPAIAKSPS